MKVRYYGHAGQITGYGRAAVETIKAMLSQGIDVELRALAPYDKLSFDDDALPVAKCLKRDHELSGNPDVVFVHTLPLDCPRVIAVAGNERSLVGEQLRVAYTTWEGCDCPLLALTEPLYDTFTEIWHPSAASARAWPLRGTEDVNFVLPHAFDPASLPRRRDDSARQSWAPPYTFYYIGAWTRRKNPEGLIRAYVNAFTRAEDVELHLHVPGASQTQVIAALCSTGIDPQEGLLPRIRYTTNLVSDHDIERLHANADCFVTASRGEAWNLPAFEAMLAGRHVIAPRGHGSDDFLHATTATLYTARPSPASVDVRVVGTEGDRVGVQTIGAQGLTSRSMWLEPDLVELADAMRHAYRWRTRNLRTLGGRPAHGEQLHYKMVGARARVRFEELLARNP